MSDTPYFDAYEARRRLRLRRETLTPRVTTSTNNAANTEGTTFLWGAQQEVGLGTTSNIPTYCVPGYDHIITGVYPKYRLQKTYTFIGEVRVVQDCFIESKANSQAEWLQVDESFNSYSFQ